MTFEQTFGHRFRAIEIVTLIYECYFKRLKMRGRRDVSFFVKINVVFICFVAAAMQHCLKEWKTGREPTETVNFKFETAVGRPPSDVEVWLLMNCSFVFSNS